MGSGHLSPVRLFCLYAPTCAMNVLRYGRVIFIPIINHNASFFSCYLAALTHLKNSYQIFLLHSSVLSFCTGRALLRLQVSPILSAQLRWRNDCSYFADSSLQKRPWPLRIRHVCFPCSRTSCGASDRN